VLRKKQLHGAISEPPKNWKKYARRNPANAVRCAKCGPPAQSRLSYGGRAYAAQNNKLISLLRAFLRALD
jgi:hypothetical protein